METDEANVANKDHIAIIMDIATIANVVNVANIANIANIAKALRTDSLTDSLTDGSAPALIMLVIVKSPPWETYTGCGAAELSMNISEEAHVAAASHTMGSAPARDHAKKMLWGFQYNVN